MQQFSVETILKYLPTDLIVTKRSKENNVNL